MVSFAVLLTLPPPPPNAYLLFSASKHKTIIRPGHLQHYPNLCNHHTITQELIGGARPFRIPRTESISVLTTIRTLRLILWWVEVDGDGRLQIDYRKKNADCHGLNDNFCVFFSSLCSRENLCGLAEGGGVAVATVFCIQSPTTTPATANSIIRIPVVWRRVTETVVWNIGR